MVELNQTQIDMIINNCDISYIQNMTNTTSAKYLFKSDEDKIKFEIRQLNIIEKELIKVNGHNKSMNENLIDLKKKIQNRKQEIKNERKKEENI